ncbi:MAG: tail fiber domain-containing protein [Flavobacteriales bacterium]|nr:tail fiber domain-containing protein [Flavobacteriales bacterium]
MNPIYNATIGTAPSDFATLRVRGDQLPVNDAFGTSLCTFRTDVQSGNNQNWSMVRGALEIGRIYHTNPNNSLHIKVTQPRTASQYNAHLFLRNYYNDGLKLSANSEATVVEQVNAFASTVLDRVGFFAMGAADNGWNALAPSGPWTRLHLVHEDQGASAPNFGFRGWMVNGVTLTGYSDLAYFGQWYDAADPDDNTNTVMAWGDDDLPAGAGHAYDNFEFRFVGTPNATGSAGTTEGLEMMRLRPYRATTNDAIEGFVGIGDWTGAGTGPLERLDLLDRTIRLRDFSTGGTTNYQSTTADRVLVADPADGTVYWRPFTDFAGQTDCDWTVVPGTGAGTNKLYTAYGPAVDGCPDGTDAVGIGTNAPAAKLHVATDAFGTGLKVSNTISGSVLAYGIFSDLNANASSQNWALFGKAQSANGSQTIGAYGLSNTSGTGQTFGALGEASNTSSGETIGVWGKATNTGSGKEIGVKGSATASATSADTYGMYALATNTNSITSVEGVHVEANAHDAATYGVYATATNLVTTTKNVIGVRARAIGNASNAANTWAFWSEGSSLATGGGTWQTSDAMFKDNVEDIANATDLLGQLAPKTYAYNTTDFDYMNFPHEPQYGLIAQDVEAVIPDLVREVHRPADLDSLGNVLNPALTFKAMNYGGLIPLLVAAVKEQQATIQQQADRLDQMEQSLAACCNATDAVGGHAPIPNTGSDGTPGERSTTASTADLVIAPNPFAESTTVSYRLPQAGAVRLEVSSSAGMQLLTLREGQAEAGAYSLTWNT